MSAFEQVGQSYYPGSSVGNKVYQDMSFLGYGHPSHRKKTLERAQHLAQHVQFEGKHVLDLGCSNGALAMALALHHGAQVTGVDLDPQSIDVAVEVAREKDIDGVEFWCANLVSGEFFSLLKGGDYDIAVWLSQFMWLWRSEGLAPAVDVLRRVSEVVPILLFETAQAPGDGAVGDRYALDGTQGVIEFLRQWTLYTSFEDLGYVPGWSKRSVILATR